MVCILVHIYKKWSLVTKNATVSCCIITLIMNILQYSLLSKVLLRSQYFLLVTKILVRVVCTQNSLLYILTSTLGTYKYSLVLISTYTYVKVWRANASTLFQKYLGLKYTSTFTMSSSDYNLKSDYILVSIYYKYYCWWIVKCTSRAK